MATGLRLPVGSLFLALLCAANSVQAEPSQAELMKLLERLNERLEKLEKRNAELEQKMQAVQAQPVAPAGAELERRVKSLEDANVKITRGLESENLSENEPELTYRLKAIEYQSLNTLKAARTVEALDGITAGMSFTTVAQRPSGLGSDSPVANSQLNYRGDVFVSLPLAKIGDTDSKVFAQFRLGQGTGLNAMTTYSRPNASAFRVLSAAPDDSVAVLGQAWYQAAVPMPFGGFKPNSRETLEINFGKMDPFVFFDQNAVANDETRQFLNTVFVHNPLLDAGGDIGVDANGFAPGFRVSYYNYRMKPETWRVSLGVSGAGQGANYTRFFSSPLIIAQAETQRKFFEGLTGNYRLYYWHNGQAPGYDGKAESHSGLGLSADQRYGDAMTLFGRYGRQVAEHSRFDRALTVGAEFGGSYWSRGGDAIGVALGGLRTSDAFARDSATLDVNGDGTPDFGFAAGGFERVAELYYRYRINKQFELSPDFQYIGAPAGNQAAAAVKIFGLRAQLGF